MKNTKIVSLVDSDRKFLVLEEAQNTLATMVMLGQVDIYWLDAFGDRCYGATLVDNPQTIFGGSPNVFGIEIP